MSTKIRRVALIAAASVVAACTKPSTPPLASSPPSIQSLESAYNTTVPKLVVHKAPTCSCCELWVRHMSESGFEVSVINTSDLTSIKRQSGVPAGKESCHTATVNGYFIEGHVPAEDVIRLLRLRPNARGISVPGMPSGSPGMEVPSGKVQPYSVLLIAKDGSVSEFSRHGN